MTSSARPPTNAQSTVLILLSSYNGASFIGEQIESIQGQTFRDWRLLVRDDGSSDGTKRILMTLGSLDHRIAMLEDDCGNVGPWASFGLLLSAAMKTNARYIFLSDQDDVWLPTKVADQLAAVTSTEDVHGASQPVLVHSDLEVVDENLGPLRRSFRDFQGLSHSSHDPLRTLLLHNGVVGCTIALNRALLEVAVPVPVGSAHDWWVALCAAATGRVVSMKEPTVRYRQHASNTIGARGKREFIGRMLRHPFAFVSDSLSAFEIGVRQSAELARRMAEQGVNPNRQRRVQEYAEAFGARAFMSRVRHLHKSGAKPRRTLSTVVLYGILAIYPHWETGSRV
jgi:rhamnosyltransferase